MSSTRHRWFAVAAFFAFMLIHQADRNMIGPLTTPIMETFHINEAQMGAVSTAALLVGAMLYPLWGYLYDRYARARLLALASFIWGATTMLNASAPSYLAFLGTRASTGIDDSSYPGLYSMVADYFKPGVRGKVYGLLELTGPLGYLLAMVLALTLGEMIGWRKVYYITGLLGILLAAVIFFGVREPLRGSSEPELAELEHVGSYRFDWQTAKGLFRKPTMFLLFAQGFFGVFPWQVLVFWVFRYLETERGYSASGILITMSIVILVLACGYVLGGAAGDVAFKRTPRGRMLVSMVAVLLSALFLTVAVRIPVESRGLFFVFLVLTAIFMPFASPNVASAVNDIILPEVRSTAIAVQYFIENAGAASAPLLAGLIAMHTNLGTAMLAICTPAWLLSALSFGIAARLIPHDMAVLRAQLRERAALERAYQALQANDLAQ
ncbi:MAG: MFS transporter [Anaerolineae bacterium]|nr:MFS transporter [Anaerolineae bacterium]